MQYYTFCYYIIFPETKQLELPIENKMENRINISLSGGIFSGTVMVSGAGKEGEIWQ